jgi:hypothetical protein
MLDALRARTGTTPALVLGVGKVSGQAYIGEDARPDVDRSLLGIMHVQKPAKSGSNSLNRTIMEMDSTPLLSIFTADLRGSMFPIFHQPLPIT